MEDNAELESFRRQWREEVARRSKPREGTRTTTGEAPAPPLTRFPPTRHEASDRKEVEEEEGPPPASFDPDALAQEVEQLNVEGDDGDEFTRRNIKEPSSALEHFERAVEKEAEGSLGDSLQHYRKAYRVSRRREK